jgi:hypothetical protein
VLNGSEPVNIAVCGQVATHTMHSEQHNSIVRNIADAERTTRRRGEQEQQQQQPNRVDSPASRAWCRREQHGDGDRKSCGAPSAPERVCAEARRRQAGWEALSRQHKNDFGIA